MPSDSMPARSAIIVPTLNAVPWLSGLLSAITALPQRPARVLFIDSTSTDDTVARVQGVGYHVHSIGRNQFGHGRTRNLAARLCADCDFLVFLTQDARPEGPNWLECLLAPFADPQVGLVYGRQLPRSGAGLSERYAREFNYPERPERSVLADLPQRGIKALFCSNSFAAYRHAALLTVGGFPDNVPMGEDLSVALRLLQHGYSRVYQPTARAVHSHDYNVQAEFQRYFDIGTLLVIDDELRRVRLGSSREGWRYLRGELATAWRSGRPGLLPGIALRALAKLAGLALGLRSWLIPVSWRRRLSMHSGFWG